MCDAESASMVSSRMLGRPAPVAAPVGATSEIGTEVAGGDVAGAIGTGAAPSEATAAVAPAAEVDRVFRTGLERQVREVKEREKEDEDVADGVEADLHLSASTNVDGQRRPAMAEAEWAFLDRGLPALVRGPAASILGSGSCR